MIYTILSILLAAAIYWITRLTKKQKAAQKELENSHGQVMAALQDKHTNEVAEFKAKIKDEILSMKKVYDSQIEYLQSENEEIKRNYRNRGEIITHQILESLKKDLIRKRTITAEEMIIMPNVFIPDENRTTRQIDHLVLLPSGIYVIETKHWKGHIVLGMTKKNSGKFSFIADLLNSSNEETLVFDKDKSGLTINSYGNPIQQAATTAFILKEYLKRKAIQVGWIDSVVFFNYEGSVVHDRSANDKVFRKHNKDEFILFFNDELKKKEKYNVQQLHAIKEKIESSNYI